MVLPVFKTAWSGLGRTEGSTPSLLRHTFTLQSTLALRRTVGDVTSATSPLRPRVVDLGADGSIDEVLDSCVAEEDLGCG